MKNKKWGYIKLKCFHTARKLSTKEPTEWEEILANNTSNKELISKPHKELIECNIQKQKKIFFKWARRSENTLLQRKQIDGQ